MFYIRSRFTGFLQLSGKHNPHLTPEFPSTLSFHLRNVSFPRVNCRLRVPKTPVNCLESPKHAHYIRYTFNTLVDCFDL